MYRKQSRENQNQIQFVCLEDLVPKDHILREIDRAIDFNFIYDEVKDMYSDYEGGRPGIDPVSLFKIVFIQYLFGIRSMRQTIKEIEVNNAYRWFIGYGLFDPIPHFSTFGKNYVRRFKDTNIFENIFSHILKEAVKAGFIDASTIFIDGTHIKANANKRKHEKVKVDKPIKQYQSELEAEINEDREIHNKKPFQEKNNSSQQVEKTKSTTDPESGLFVKGEHERCFAYVANTACDRNGFVLGVSVDAGNVHDSQMFHEVYDNLGEIKENTQAVAVDAGYKTPGIMREIIKDGKIPCVPYKRPMTKDGFFYKKEFVYDEHYDCYICPNNQVLKYTTTNREGYKEYKSDPKVCKNCPYRDKCTMSQNMTKVVTRHIWAEYMEQAEEYRYVPRYKEIYKERKETIERVFAEGKERHGLRYATMRGLAKLTMQVTLVFACMNLKKIALWKKKGRDSLLKSYILFLNLYNFALTKIKRVFLIFRGKPDLSTV